MGEFRIMLTCDRREHRVIRIRSAYFGFENAERVFGGYWFVAMTTSLPNALREAVARS